MGNCIFADNENRPLVTHYDMIRKGDHDDDYGDYNTPNNAVREIKFTKPSSINIQSAPTLQLRQIVKNIS